MNVLLNNDDFHPITIKSGDILGLFLPQSQDLRFVFMSETTDSPTNYYISTGPFRRSTLDEINVQNSVDSLLLQSYRLLVSVQIGMKSNNYYCSSYFPFRKNNSTATMVTYKV